MIFYKFLFYAVSWNHSVEKGVASSHFLFHIFFLFIGIPPSWDSTFHGDQNPPFAYIHDTHPEGWLELGKRSYLERQLKKNK